MGVVGCHWFRMQHQTYHLPASATPSNKGALNGMVKQGGGKGKEGKGEGRWLVMAAVMMMMI